MSNRARKGSKCTDADPILPRTRWCKNCLKKAKRKCLRPDGATPLPPTPASDRPTRPRSKVSSYVPENTLRPKRAARKAARYGASLTPNHHAKNQAAPRQSSKRRRRKASAATLQMRELLKSRAAWRHKKDIQRLKAQLSEAELAAFESGARVMRVQLREARKQEKQVWWPIHTHAPHTTHHTTHSHTCTCL